MGRSPHGQHGISRETLQSCFAVPVTAAVSRLRSVPFFLFLGSTTCTEQVRIDKPAAASLILDGVVLDFANAPNKTKRGWLIMPPGRTPRIGSADVDRAMLSHGPHGSCVNASRVQLLRQPKGLLIRPSIASVASIAQSPRSTWFQRFFMVGLPPVVCCQQVRQTWRLLVVFLPCHMLRF